MSSSISGVYALAVSVADAIRQQALQELQSAQQEFQGISNEIRENEKAYNAMLRNREERESNRRSAEEKNQQTIDLQLQNADADLIAIQQEAEALLDVALEQISEMDDCVTEKTELLEKVRNLRKSVSIFGVSSQTIENVRSFARSILPDALERTYMKQEKQRLEQSTHDQLNVRGTVSDRSMQFVSFDMQIQKGKHEEKPWDTFIRRLQKLAEEQEAFGEITATSLLEEALQIPQSQQNQFMLQQRQLIQNLEEEAASFSSTIAMKSRQYEELYCRYVALYQMCVEINNHPLLENGASIERIQVEHDRLLNAYLEWKNQLYIEKAFREVFEARGFAFESLTTDGSRNIKIEFSLGEEAGVRVMRGASGAFDMVFFGVSSTEQVSQDQRRELAEKAKGFCKLIPGIQQALAERGIEFDQRVEVQPSAESVSFETRKTNREYHQAQKMARRL